MQTSTREKTLPLSPGCFARGIKAQPRTTKDDLPRFICCGWLELGRIALLKEML